MREETCTNRSGFMLKALRSITSAVKDVAATMGGGEGVTLGAHRGTVRAIAFSPDGKLAATSSGDHTCMVWDLERRVRMATLGSVPENLTGGGVGSGHKHILTSVSISPDGAFVATASYDKTLRVWSLPEGEPLAIMSGHMQIVSAVAFQPGIAASALLSASVDSTVRLWRLSQEGDENWEHFPWGNGVLLEFAFAHTQASFLSDDHEDSEDFRRRTNRQRKHIPQMKCELTTLTCSSPVVAAVFSSGGEKIVAVSSNGAIKVWNAAMVSPSTLSQAQLLDIPGRGARVDALCTSPCSGRIAVGSADCSITLYDLVSGALLQRIENLQGYPIAMVFSPEHPDILVACCGGHKLLVVHLPTRRCVAKVCVCV